MSYEFSIMNSQLVTLNYFLENADTSTSLSTSSADFYD